MTERPRFFDDLAGVAGGAFSALAGMREEAEAMIRARVDEAIRRLDLVRREDMEAVQDMAANARAGQEAADARIAALEARITALEAAKAPAHQPAQAATPGSAANAPSAPPSPPSPDGVA